MTTQNAQIEFKCSYNNGYYLTTDLDLSGRGIRLSGDGSDHARKKKTYHVTKSAFEKIEEKYSTIYISN